MKTKEGPCRCGHTGGDPHPCHWGGYTCRKPATFRLYNAYPAALAGVQLKFSASSTWACDEHWQEFKTKYPEATNGSHLEP